VVEGDGNGAADGTTGGGGGGDGDEVDSRWFPTAGDVLRVDPDGTALSLGLREALSRGRNDGLANMVKGVQDQVRSLLLLPLPRSGGKTDAASAVAAEAAAVPRHRRRAMRRRPLNKKSMAMSGWLVAPAVATTTTDVNAS